MANYVQDFQSFSAASGLPTGLTERWDPGTYSTVDDGGDIILRQASSASARYLASLDAIDGDANRDNCEVLARVRSSSVAAGYHAGVALRASGTSTTELGYYCAIFSDDMRLARANGAGSTVTIQTASLTLSADTWYWIRFRANGTSLRARIWADGGSEPGTWDIDTTDANISAAGWAGFFSGTSTKDCAEMAIATNGDTATMSSGGTPAGQADETDTALALAAVQIAPVGAALETDTALALSAGASAPVGMATEADTALALLPVQIIATGLASEVDTALALSAGASSPVGMALETDAALALAAVQILPAGLSLETDSALALSSGVAGPVGMAAENDAAFALAGVQRRSVGMAVETDTALALLDGDTTIISVVQPYITVYFWKRTA